VIPQRVREHAVAFNAAVRSGDWAAFAETFTEDAVMRFEGLPFGPYAGRAAIAAAYAAQPATGTLRIRDVVTDGDTDVVRFAWDAGGGGGMTVRWSAGRVADLTVRLDRPLH
jgi:steroid Delta-isomerase